MSNQYTYRVPFTEANLRHCYTELRMSQQEIADKFRTTQKVVWLAMSRLGVKTRIAAKRNQSGSLNSSWKGGRTLAAKKRLPEGVRSPFGNGYFYVRLPNHPNANKSGYVAEHVVVATKERGRPLAHGECVHHKNLNKHDNAPTNLAIGTHQQHARWHCQLEMIAAKLLAVGLIRFAMEVGYEPTADLLKFVRGYRGN